MSGPVFVWSLYVAAVFCLSIVAAINGGVAGFFALGTWGEKVLRHIAAALLGRPRSAAAPRPWHLRRQRQPAALAETQRQEQQGANRQRQKAV